MRSRSLNSFKSAAAGALMAAAGANTLDACTFGPPAWRPQTNFQPERDVRLKLTEPRHRQAAMELAALPQVELHFVQDELREQDAALSSRLAIIETGAIAGNAFLHADTTTPIEAVESAFRDLRGAQVARTHVEVGSMDLFLQTMRRHAQTDFSPTSADRLIRFLAAGLELTPDELSAHPERIDHLQPYLTQEECAYVARYLGTILSARIQDATVRDTVERAATELATNGTIPRPLLVTLVRDCLRDGALFESIRDTVARHTDRQQADLLSRVIPSLRAGLLRAAIAAQHGELPLGEARFTSANNTNRPGESQRHHRHHHRP